MLGACDRSSPEPPLPEGGPPAARATPLKAADPSCSLPLRNFGRSRMAIVGSILDYPTNRVIPDRAGRILWNAQPIGPRLLEDYITAQASHSPAPLLVISPERDAPCALVREVLAAAHRAGRCRPDTCVFEWPGTDAPPAPAPAPLPDRVHGPG